MYQCIGTFYHVSGSEYTAYVQFLVENQNIGILATLERTFAVSYTDDVGWSFGSHTDSVSHRNVSFECHNLYEFVHGGYTSCQRRMVSQLADTVFNDVAWIVYFTVISSIFQCIGYQTSLFYAFYLIDKFQDSSRQVDTVGNDL